MTKLTQTARDTIKFDYRGLTIAGYVRHFFGDAGWGGDRCGCADNRCIGFHHDDESDCGCLPVWLDHYAAAKAGAANQTPAADEPSEIFKASRDPVRHPRNDDGRFTSPKERRRDDRE